MSGIIQIAGVRDAEEAGMLVECGVDWIGFPFRLDHHAEDLTETAARDIIRKIPKRVLPVLITYLTDLNSIIQLCAFLRVGGVQLHGPALASLGESLKMRAPDLRLIRSLVIRPGPGQDQEEEIRKWSPHVDYFLTDSFDPATGASGATGKTHDWELSRRLVAISPKPLILAGGLRGENVGAAIAQVRPAGVDAHTGVEDAASRKDPELVADFVAAARSAFSSLVR